MTKEEKSKSINTSLMLMTKADVKIMVVVNNEDSYTAKGPLKFDGEHFSVESLAFKIKHVSEVTMTEADYSEAEVYITV